MRAVIGQFSGPYLTLLHGPVEFKIVFVSNWNRGVIYHEIFSNYIPSKSLNFFLL